MNKPRIYRKALRTVTNMETCDKNDIYTILTRFSGYEGLDGELVFWEFYRHKPWFREWNKKRIIKALEKTLNK